MSTEPPAMLVTPTPLTLIARPAPRQPAPSDCALEFPPAQELRTQFAWTYDADLDTIEASEAPRQVVSVCYEPTNECPGKCPYCLIENHDEDQNPAQMMHVIQHLAVAGVRRVGFGGGEPLLRPEIFTQACYLKSSGVGTLLRTSGMFELDSVETWEAFDWVDFSLDSIDPAIFRSCRPGVPLDVLVQNIRTLVAAGLRIRVSILLTKRNASTVLRTVSWLAQEGVREVRFQRLVRRGKANRTWEKLKLEDDYEDALLASAMELSTDLGMNPRELRSVSSTTLCIVKGNGEVYIGTETGTILVGTVCDPAWTTDSTAKILAAQNATYLAAFDAGD